MEWEMWRRVLLVLIVVGMGGRHVEGSNKEVFKKLCNITRGLKGLMGKNGESEKALGEALYGETGKGHFDEHGTFTDGCGILGGPNHRSQYCSHLPGPQKNGHGCFGDSLLGTLLCTCVPGNQQEKDLCGLGENVTNGATWTSWIPNSTKGLLQKVWEEVKRKCFNNNTGTVNQEELNATVKKIKEEALEKKVNSGNNVYYLGGDKTTGQCSGVNPGDACVTYPPKSGKFDEPDIQWADKILTALQTLKSQQQTSSTKSTTQDTDPQHSTDSHENLSDQDGDKQEGEEQEDEEEPEENPSPQDHSNKLRQKRKRRSTKNQPAEQPAESLKAILHKNDGSFLPEPFWLLSAVVF